jgi:hypothetical protein
MIECRLEADCFFVKKFNSRARYFWKMVLLHLRLRGGEVLSILNYAFATLATLTKGVRFSLMRAALPLRSRK